MITHNYDIDVFTKFKPKYRPRNFQYLFSQDLILARESTPLKLYVECKKNITLFLSVYCWSTSFVQEWWPMKISVEHKPRCCSEQRVVNFDSISPQPFIHSCWRWGFVPFHIFYVKTYKSRIRISKKYTSW